MVGYDTFKGPNFRKLPVMCKGFKSQADYLFPVPGFG